MSSLSEAPNREKAPIPVSSEERTLSAVIPVYNDAEVLPELLARLEPALDALASKFEVLLVDDGSSDSSWSVIQELSKTRPWLRGIHLMRNYGQHNALLCGIRLAEYEIVVTLDDDLQHPPEEIAKLIEKLDEGFDVVYGTPEAEQHGFLRNLASRATKLALQGALGAETARKVSAFRVFRTQVRDAFANYQSQFVSVDVLLTWASTRFTAIPVQHDPRTVGTSNYTFGKLSRHALNMLTGFSTLPLQLASLIGFIFTLFGIGVFLYVALRRVLQGAAVPGFAFLASVIAIFSGAQLFALGIIGEYLARMHFRMMERPPYVVRTTTLEGPSL